MPSKNFISRIIQSKIFFHLKQLQLGLYGETKMTDDIQEYDQFALEEHLDLKEFEDNREFNKLMYEEKCFYIYI